MICSCSTVGRAFVYSNPPLDINVMCYSFTYNLNYSSYIYFVVNLFVVVQHVIYKVYSPVLTIYIHFITFVKRCWYNKNKNINVFISI